MYFALPTSGADGAAGVEIVGTMLSGTALRVVARTIPTMPTTAIIETTQRIECSVSMSNLRNKLYIYSEKQLEHVFYRNDYIL